MPDSPPPVPEPPQSYRGVQSSTAEKWADQLRLQERRIAQAKADIVEATQREIQCRVVLAALSISWEDLPTAPLPEPEDTTS